MSNKTQRTAILFMSFFASMHVFAKEAAVMEVSAPPDFAIGTLIGSLLLVISCIFVFAYLVKKTNLMKNTGNNQLKLISTYALNNKGRVQIIECNGKQYLLGVTEKNINLIDKFDAPIVDQSTTLTDNKTPFAAIFSKINQTNKKNNE